MAVYKEMCDRPPNCTAQLVVSLSSPSSLSLSLSSSLRSSPSSLSPLLWQFVLGVLLLRYGEREGGSLPRLCPVHGSPHDGYCRSARQNPPTPAPRTAAVRLRGLVRRHGQSRQDHRALLERALRRHLPPEARRPVLRRPGLHRLSRFPVWNQIAAPLQVQEVWEEAPALRHELRRRRLWRLRRPLLPGQPDGADRPLPGAGGRGCLFRPRPGAVDGGGLHRRQRLHVLRGSRWHPGEHEEGVHPQVDRAAEVGPEAAAPAGRGEGGGHEPAPHRVRPAHVERLRLQALQRDGEPRRDVPQRAAGRGRVGAQRGEQHGRCCCSLRDHRPPRRLHYGVKQRDEEVRRCPETLLQWSGQRQQLREHRRQRDRHVHGLQGAPAEVLLGHRPPHAGRLESRLLHAGGFSQLPPQLSLQPQLISICLSLRWMDMDGWMLSVSSSPAPSSPLFFFSSRSSNPWLDKLSVPPFILNVLHHSST